MSEVDIGRIERATQGATNWRATIRVTDKADWGAFHTIWAGTRDATFGVSSVATRWATESALNKVCDGEV